jgi:hypothetical protein
MLIVGVLLGNFIPGLLFGWLFWRRGLEAAVLSHAFAHCVNAIVSRSVEPPEKLGIYHPGLTDRDDMPLRSGQ